MARYEHLFSPLQLRNVTLRNRIVSSAHGTRLADGASDSQTDRGVPSQRTLEYHLRRAEGGIGLIITEPTVVFPLDERWLAGWRPVVEALRSEGVVVFAQLIYGGSQTSGREQLRPPYAPSALPWEPGGEYPRAMSVKNIEQMVASYARAGGLAIDAGFDGVEIHGAHGYLIHQFLSPLSNHRTDQYGGPRDHRARFVMELMAAVRQAIGTQPVLGLRLSGSERVDGGVTLDEQVATIGELDSAVDIDYFSISSGSYRSLDSIIPSMYKPSVANEDLVTRIREAHPSLTLFIAGRITTPSDANSLIERGIADATIMTRSLIADPDLPRKAQSGLEEQIRYCMGTNQGCWGRVRSGHHISCVLNPDTGREREEKAVTHVDEPRRVLVIGGGPAGCEAARQAALRGHHVTLWEREARLGGTIGIAALAPYRADLSEVARWYDQDLRRLGVEVVFGRDANVEAVRQFGAHVVVIGAGALPTPPDIPGLDTYPYWTNLVDALAMTFDPGERSVVYSVSTFIDPMTVADKLAQLGSQVTLITPHPRIGRDVDDATFPAIMRRLQDQQVEIITSTEIVAIDDGTVVLGGHHGKSTLALPEPTMLVLDVGWQPGPMVDELVAGVDVPTIVVGDALAARGLQAAVWDGARAGRSL